MTLSRPTPLVLQTIARDGVELRLGRHGERYDTWVALTAAGLAAIAIGVYCVLALDIDVLGALAFAGLVIMLVSVTKIVTLKRHQIVHIAGGRLSVGEGETRPLISFTAIRVFHAEDEVLVHLENEDGRPLLLGETLRLDRVTAEWLAVRLSDLIEHARRNAAPVSP